MSDIAISLNLLVELCFFIWEILKIILNLVCLKNNNRWGIDFSYWLKKLLQMIGPRRVIAELVVLQADLLGKSCRIFVIYLAKIRKENSWMYSIFHILYIILEFELSWFNKHLKFSSLLMLVSQMVTPVCMKIICAACFCFFRISWSLVLKVLAQGTLA